MTQSQVYEGTAEEIAEQLRSSNLNGRLKAIVTTEEREEPIPNGYEQRPPGPPKKLRGYGMFARVPGGSEAFALDKQKEIEREDGKFR
jgi:hypothetical protein